MAVKHSLTYNGMMNLIYTGSRFLFPLITTPFLARVLGAESTGRVDFAISVVSYFVALASLGIPNYGIRVCAEAMGDKAKLSKSVQELLVCNIVSMLISYVAYLVLIFSISKFKNDITVFLLVSILIPLRACGIDWFYQGIEQYDYITIRTIIVRCISTLMIFIAIRSPGDYLWYAVSSIILDAGASICNIYNLRKYVSFKRQNNYDIKKHIRPILMFFTASIAISIYHQMDATMIGLFKDSEETGYYEFGVKAVRVLFSLLIGITTVAIPRVVGYIHNENVEKEIILRQKGSQLMYILSMPIVVFLVSFGKDIVLFLFGEGYEVSATVFRVAAVIILPVAFSNYLSNFLLLPHGKEKQRAVSVNIGLVVNLILNVLLIPKYGAVGATIATVFTELSVTICLFIFSRNYLKSSFANFAPLKKLCLTILTMFFAYELYNVDISSLFIKLMLTACLYTVGYVFMLLLFRETVFIEQIKKYFKTIGK